MVSQTYDFANAFLIVTPIIEDPRILANPYSVEAYTLRISW